MDWRLCKAHQHPELLKPTPVGNKGQVIGRGGLEWDVVEASFQVQHNDPLSPHKLHLVQPYVVELVLILSNLFVDQDNVLAYSVRLPGLNTQH